jgi:hypothetical protein
MRLILVNVVVSVCAEAGMRIEARYREQNECCSGCFECLESPVK